MERRKQSAPSPEYPVQALYELGEENGGYSLNFVIVDVKRYQVNQHFIKSINFVTDVADAYDLFLTDGKYITKAILRPDQNYLVEKHHIYKGCTVSVEQFTRRYDETNPKSLGAFIILSKLSREGDDIISYEDQEVLSMEWHIMNRWVEDPEIVARLAGMNEEHREKFIKDLIDDLHHVPLVGRRGCYLHLHANDCGLGLKWDAKDLVRGAVDSEDGLLFNPDTEQLVPLDKMIATFQENKYKHYDYWRQKKFRPVVCGRIIRKSRLYNFGKKTDQGENSRWPFKFNFTITDGTAEVDCVVWNRFCPTLFAALDVGDVICMGKFRTKTPYSAPEKPAPDEDNYVPENPSNLGEKDLMDAQVESISQGVMEIAINPGAEIRVITGPVMNSPIISAIPGIPIHIRSAEEIVQLQDGGLCDICGLVAFSGDIVTTSYKSMYRWILLRTSDNPQPHPEFWVKLIPNSNAKTFEAISMGDACMITNAKVETTVYTSTSRLIHLHCTTWSTISMDRGQFELLANEGMQQAVEDVLTMMDRLREDPAHRPLLDEFQIFSKNLGNNFRQHLPSCRGRLQTYKDLYGIAPDQFTTMREIPQICADLNWGEMKHILLQGYIKQITLVTRKQLYQGEIIDANEKFKVATDMAAPVNRELFLLHVEDLNHEKSVLLTIPVFILLYEGSQYRLEGAFAVDDQRQRFRRLMKFLGHSVPELCDMQVQKELLEPRDSRRRLKALMSKIAGDPGKKSPHRFIFGVSLSRKEHNDVECVVNNVFSRHQ